MNTTGLTPTPAQDEQFDTTKKTQDVNVVENSSIQSPEASDSQAQSVSPVAETVDVVVELASDSNVEAELDNQEKELVAQIDEADDELEFAESDEEVLISQDEKANPNDYSGKSRAELIEILVSAIENKAVGNLRNIVEAIKIAYYKVQREDVQRQKDEFVANGGNIEEFQVQVDPLEDRLKDAINVYRQKRDEYLASIEQEKQNNLDLKLSIIEELKELVNSSETLNNTYNAFRDLQSKWRDVGVIPQDKVKDIWDTYHHHVENFYNFVKINKELRDIDLKRNLDAKIALCEEAEALLLDPSPTAAFHSLQKLHQQWREVGPVATEFKEQVWVRFKDASSKINKRHQDYYDQIKDEQLRNLALKEELCVKVESLANQPFTSRKEWTDASEQITEIQKVWKTIGFAPKKDNTRVYDRFRMACDKFFEAKREFFSGVKNEMEENLQIKVELCIQAESLADSTDWKKATDALIELQRKWKETGATSRKQADVVWKRFRAACDSFFERKAEYFSSVDAKFNENLEAKREILDELKGIVKQETKITFDTIKEYQRRWSEIGFVPMKQKDAISKEYKEVVDQIFAMLRGDERQRKMDSFKNKLSSLRDMGSRKLSSEKDKLQNKIRQMESDIQLWENNIGFFVHSKNTEQLVADVRKKIDRARAEINETLEKIKMVDTQSNMPKAQEQQPKEDSQSLVDVDPKSPISVDEFDMEAADPSIASTEFESAPIVIADETSVYEADQDDAKN